MKELLELIAKALVDNPDDVSVSEVGGEQTTILELRVAQEDLGKVIGKQGRTARAIRTLQAGESYLAPAVAAKLVAEVSAPRRFAT